MRVLIIADDLTGALDTTCRFGKGSAVLLSGEADADFVGVTTDSRLLRPEEARSRVREILNLFPSWQYLYKKVDSTMRGNVGAELGEICEFLNAEMPFTPAYPEQGRIVIDGTLYVRGKLLEETSYAKELPITSSNILEILRSTTNLRVGYWEDRDAMIRTFRNIRERRDLSEAMETIIDEGLRVMGGSAGLAIELSEFLGCERGDEVRAHGPVLFLSGSGNEVTREQFSVLAREVPVFGYDEEGIRSSRRRLLEGADAAMLFDLGKALKGIRELVDLIIDSRPSALVVVGGETLRAVLRQLEVSAIRMGSYPEDGVAAGWIVGGPLDGTPLISKAGGFGDPETLLRVLRIIKELG
ncbi:MAG: four-carbon acid sugar kinase family protein [Candidatus Korarchaeota archaeon NZ13-K]|nr:MAG: four-carbon acid sugar kinase family protein [Candidatus Korarchaeota archaeon NZ13-K]